MANNISIEEYLNSSDWVYDIHLTEGVVGDYLWLRCPEFRVVDFRDVIDLPMDSYSVLVTYWDWSEGGPEVYSKKQNWRVIGKVAFKGPTTDCSDLNLAADTALMLIDHQVKDSDLMILSEYEDTSFFEDINAPDVQCFWQVLNALKPYFYISYFDELAFVTVNKSLYRQFVERAKVGYERIDRTRTSAYRAKL
jgi:hypothetical protein